MTKLETIVRNVRPQLQQHEVADLVRELSGAFVTDATGKVAPGHDRALVARAFKRAPDVVSRIATDYAKGISDPKQKTQAELHARGMTLEDVLP